MAKLGVLVIPGRSGATYRFDAFPLHTVWPSLSAVYIITHRQLIPGKFAEHVCVKLGHTHNLQELEPHPDHWATFHGANCMCILREPDEARRREIVIDIADATLLPPP